MKNRNQVAEILLLDDDEDDYILLKSCLEGAFGDRIGLDWYQKDGVSNELICSGNYVITLVDYRLGNENGLQIIQKAKAQCPERVVFLFTSWTFEVTFDQAIRAGADGFIKKQELSIGSLQTALARFLPGLDNKGS